MATRSAYWWWVSSGLKMPADSSPSTALSTRRTAFTATSSHGLPRAGLVRVLISISVGLGTATHLSIRVLCTLRVSLHGRPCSWRACLIKLNSVPCEWVGG